MSAHARATWAIFCVALAFVIGACGQGDDGKAGKSVPPAWVLAREMPGHLAHLGKSTTFGGAPHLIACDDCHDVAQSGFASPGARPCARCHDQETKHAHTGSVARPTTCVTCHLFTRAEGAPLAAPTCVQCHARSDATAHPLEHHASDEAKCASCHTVHADPPTVVADCAKCHQTIGAQHGKSAVAAGVPNAGNSGVCGACHAPHSAAKGAATRCAQCHVASVAEQSGSIASPLVSEAPKVTPRGNHVAGHEACTTCHAPHDAKKADALPCTGCHADHVVQKPSSGHAQCTSCHAPHAPTVSAKASCSGCHQDHAALGAAVVDKHADCASCHTVHAPTREPEHACESCHANVHPKHPSVATSPSGTGTRVCISCHTPHPKGAIAAARSCTSCHAALAKNDLALHATTTVTKVRCTSCHQAHAFELEVPPKPSFCTRCHSKVEKSVALMGAVAGPGHGDCLGCHGGDSHAPALRVSCASCHAKEASTAGGHAKCASCHETHSGALIVGAIKKPIALAATAAFCTSCHADKKKALHAEIAGACGNCHRPHGPSGVASPPACVSCHAPAKLPGLHLSATHEKDCRSCHTAHSAPSASRETCTSTCHTDRRTHQPDASTCKGCHVFRN